MNGLLHWHKRGPGVFKHALLTADVREFSVPVTFDGGVPDPESMNFLAAVITARSIIGKIEYDLVKVTPKSMPGMPAHTWSAIVESTHHVGT